MKKTPICHPERPYFSKDLCRNCYEKQLRDNNTDFHKRQLENSRKWAETHKERKKEISQDYNKKLTKVKKREMWLRKKYKITLDTFNNILSFQENKCFICEQQLKEGDRFMHIDHCHKTGKIRGILCSQCNWFISKIDGIKNCLENLNNYVKNQGSLWEKQIDLTKEKID